MQIRPQFVTWLKVDEVEYDAVVESIRAETTLLGALRKAQPLLDRGGEKFDDFALDQLREANIVLNKEIAIPDSPTEAQLKAIENYLLAETRIDQELVNYMSADVTAYLQAHAELEREEAEVLAALTVARLQIVAWTRAHQAMAQGVKDSDSWLKIAFAAAERTKQVLTL
jgi:hypothetical protein